MVDALWGRVQDALRSRLSAKDFDSWIQPLRPREFAAGRFVLETPTAFSRDWLIRHLRADLEGAIEAVTAEPTRVRLEVNASLGDRRPHRGARRATSPAREPKSESNGHTFDTFVVGGSNVVAFRACRSVVEAPGTRFNPLVIHGGVGLGKTHLLSATAAALRASGVGVRLVAAEHFVNELVHAVRHDGMRRFRERYRDAGVLIVDDVQFLAGKRKSQEELLHTFNALRELGKQIVLASDRPPEELTEMAASLRSRLASGLLAGISEPDEAMRVELVRRKVAERGLSVAPGVHALLAEQEWSNVRELEGVVVRLEALALLQGAELDEATALLALGAARRRPPRGMGLQRIMQAVCEEFDVDEETLASRTRAARVALARQVLFRAARRLTELPLKAIGESVGRRDHSTVAHGVQRIERRLAADPKLRERVRRLEKALSRCGGVEWAHAMDGRGGARGVR